MSERLWTHHGADELAPIAVERERPWSRQQIEECEDLHELQGRLAQQEEVEVTIRTVLEFPDEPLDVEWFGRARAALIHFRVSNSRLVHCIKRRRSQIEMAKKAAKEAA